MFISQRNRAFVNLKAITFAKTLPTPKRSPLFRHHPLPFSLNFCTSASHPHSFAESYLINTFGFSPESAFKASKHVGFKTSEQPDSVLNFFRNRGFSKSQVHDMISKAPWLLSCDPHKRVLPKFEFLLSKGASSSEIIHLMSKHPRIVGPSLENHIVPVYELVNRFFQSDEETIDCIIHNPSFLSGIYVEPNIKLLLDSGMTDSNITRLLRTWSRIFTSSGLLTAVEEVKGLGFSPTKSTFGVALLAKKAVNKTRWGEKVDAFKKWGWSDENILEAFRRQPHCMLASSDKINAVMSFWVNQLGWDSLVLVKGSDIFGLSLKKRIIPRASVVQFLLKKGLRKKNTSLIWPFLISEKLFLNKFVKCFEEESSRISKLYVEKMNLA